MKKKSKLKFQAGDGDGGVLPYAQPLQSASFRNVFCCALIARNLPRDV